MTLQAAYEKSLDEAIAIVGPLNSDSASRALPSLTGGQWFVLFATMVPSIADAIAHVCASGAKVPSANYVDIGSGRTTWTSSSVDFADEVGTLTGLGTPASGDTDILFSAQVNSSAIASIDARAYLAAMAAADPNPWVRFPGGTDYSSLRSPAYDLNAGYTPWVAADDDRILALRNLIDEYQRALETVAQLVASYGNTLVPADQADQLHHMLYEGLCADCDTVVDTNIASLGDRIKGGLRAALDSSEQAVKDIGNALGKAAAEAGNLAGQVAGQFAGGFFSQATLLTLAVAGVAVYLVVIA
jgi:hypothetical protein